VRFYDGVVGEDADAEGALGGEGVEAELGVLVRSRLRCDGFGFWVLGFWGTGIECGLIDCLPMCLAYYLSTA
jgi:hypothetical protein